MSLLSSFSFAGKRLWSHRSLVLCLLIGLVAAVALAVAVPLYADGVNYNLLNTALNRTAVQSRRPAFSFIFHYVGAWHTPLELKQYTPVDALMGEQIAGVIGLPLEDPSQGITRYVSTDNLQLHPSGATIRRSQRLDLVKLAYVSGVFDHIQLIDGALPAALPETGEEDEAPVIDALVSLTLSNDLGLQVGEIYQVYHPGDGISEPFRMPVRVAGIWLPADPASEFWFYPPDSFDKKLLVAQDVFFGPVSQRLPQPVNEAVWRLAFDGSRVHSENVPGLLARVDRAQTQVNSLLPNTDLEFSPMQALRQYRRDSLALTGLLFVFSAPVLGLALYFLGLVAAMLVRRQRSEIAVLRSRGASRAWIAGIYLLEWSLLGAAALVIGPWLGVGIAQLVGQTQSFLDFSRPAELSLRLTPEVLALGLVSVGLAILFSLVPAWQAGKDTIVSYKQERARALRRPLWQRAYLDLLLLLPALYGLYTLRTEGRLQIFGRNTGSANPFENPVLFLLPTLFIISLSLLVLRLLPYGLSGLAWLAARLPGTVPVLALRQLSRSAGAHLAPLMLLIVTLSLAGFVASMAHTLDRAIEDSVYYEVGADLSLVEGGEYTGETASGPPADPFSVPTTVNVPTGGDQATLWNFLPVSDHLVLPGVQAVARVGRYDGRLSASGRSAEGRLIGIDRVDFPAVGFFRSDFAQEHVIALMNRLASDPTALLVDRGTWERFNLNTGDQVEMTVNLTERLRLTFKVAGVLDYFPTLYPEEGPFFIANLEYIFESSGGLQPYNVWLRTAPGTDSEAVIAGVHGLGVAVIRAQDARRTLDTALAAPNRQGMLGLLSVGFLAASLLTVVGFLLYALFSFRERFVQLGVLRALGLSTGQMAATLALEQFLLILTGLAAGTLIAILTASLFIPHLPVTFGRYPGTPPYTVQIAWLDMARVYLIFGGMLLLGVGTTVWSLSRMKIFQAVKLGESV